MKVKISRCGWGFQYEDKTKKSAVVRSEQTTGGRSLRWGIGVYAQVSLRGNYFLCQVAMFVWTFTRIVNYVCIRKLEEEKKHVSCKCQVLVQKLNE